MENNELLKKIGKLEFINDQLLKELEYLNELVKQIGFEEGLKTLKKAAIDLIEENSFEDTGEAI